MLYTGYTEHELQQIILILERHQVPFEVSVNEQSIDAVRAIISSESYYSQRGRAQVDNSFYAISFERNLLKNLSAEDFRELKRLRIFAEHLAEPEAPEEKKAYTTHRRSITYDGTNPKTALIIVSVLLCLCWAYYNSRG